MNEIEQEFPQLDDANVTVRRIHPSQPPTTTFGQAADPFAPPFPEKLDQLDVHPAFLSDLILKHVSLEPDCTTARIAERARLGMMITESLLQELTRDKLIEMKGVVGLHNHRYAMLERGWTKVNRLMSISTYAGPAPVSLESYAALITKQVRSRPPVTRESVDRAMANLVLSPTAKQVLGLVASSGRSLFLSGPSGNGKTVMACALVNALCGAVWIPYAIEVDGQIIRVFDRHNHQILEESAPNSDRRWIRIRPPLVVVGGELTLDSLDLVSTETQRFYEAPVQVKSNGGVLVVDDLGRQRCSAAELLNRWIIPLEHRIDYLTLSTGKKIQVPFEQIVVFATNLTTADLADEAFLRRMGYRLHVTPPTPHIYAEIFHLYARSRGVQIEPRLIEQLLRRYEAEGRVPKSCEPRDMVDRAIDFCKYIGEMPRLDEEILNVAWTGYFGAPS
jgi:hypothetical protein